jgi:signal transduction histidine kinase
MKFERTLCFLPFPYKLIRLDPFEVMQESDNPFFDEPAKIANYPDFWKSISKEGWYTCPSGYAVYARKIPSPDRKLLVLYGLKVKGRWTSKGRTEGLSIVVDSSRVEIYVEHVVSNFSRLQEDVEEHIESTVQSLLTENIHEIRSMNASLYHVGVELQDTLLHDGPYKLNLSKNIVALSELMSSRIVLADLMASNNLNEVKSGAPIPVYKKFEKIAKCYKAYASKRNIDVGASGSSQGRTSGIESFEMIPLVLIDNAVKYSPSKRNVDVIVSDGPNEIRCEVHSFGPKIEENERDLIFRKDFRGAHAIGSGQSGNGIGLYFAAKLIAIVGGSIAVGQRSEAERILGKDYFKTIFTATFPKV